LLAPAGTSGVDVGPDGGGVAVGRLGWWVGDGVSVGEVVPVALDVGAVVVGLLVSPQPARTTAIAASTAGTVAR
jgi:hypothetical protein